MVVEEVVTVVTVVEETVCKSIISDRLSSAQTQAQAQVVGER